MVNAPKQPFALSWSHKLMHAANVRLRSTEGTDEQSQSHGLDSVGCRGGERCGGAKPVRENGGGRNAKKCSAVNSRHIGFGF